MATPTWFIEEQYLNNKLVQWNATADGAGKSLAELKAAIEAAGLTPFQHFELFGAGEGVGPNEFFNADEYLANKLVKWNATPEGAGKSLADLKAAIEGAGMNAWTHYQQFGWDEGVNPSNKFDIDGYFAAKLANLQADAATSAAWAGKDVAAVKAAFKEAGIDPVSHYFAFGKTEGVAPVAAKPSSLTEALAKLQEAQQAKAEFLKQAAEIDSVKEATGATTEAKIAAAVTNADSKLATVSYKDSADVNKNIAVYTAGTVANGGDSDGVKAAKIADAEAAQAKKLADAQKALKEAQAEVAEVTNLKSAVDLFNARVEAQDVTEKALLAAEAAEAGAVASYNKVNSSNTITPDTNTGVALGVIVANTTSGRLELATGVTETSHPGIKAVLVAVQARLDAKQADTSAQDAIKAAVIAIGYIDIDTGDKDAIGAKFSTPVAAGSASDKLTQAEIQVELNALYAAAEDLGELSIDDKGIITKIDGTNIASEPAVLAFNNLKTAVNTFENTLIVGSPAYTFATAEKTAAQIAKQKDVADVELAIKALADAKEALAEAKAVAADLQSHVDAITAAEKVFDTLEVEAPVTINGTVIGTADNDLFLASETEGTIVNFNAQGKDSIFVGTDFTTLKVLSGTEVVTGRVGDVAVLEIFAKQNGSNLDLWVEQQAFAGSATGDADLVKITLAGVNANDLVLSEGFLTIA